MTEIHLSDPRDTLKMVHETLCAVQSALNYYPDTSRVDGYRDRIQRMLDDIERQQHDTLREEADSR